MSLLYLAGESVIKVRDVPVFAVDVIVVLESQFLTQGDMF